MLSAKKNVNLLPFNVAIPALIISSTSNKFEAITVLKQNQSGETLSFNRLTTQRRQCYFGLLAFISYIQVRGIFFSSFRMIDLTRANQPHGLDAQENLTFVVRNGSYATLHSNFPQVTSIL